MRRSLQGRRSCFILSHASCISLFAGLIACSSSNTPDTSMDGAGIGGGGGAGPSDANTQNHVDATMTADDGPNHCNGMTLEAGATCQTKTLASLTVIGQAYSVKGSSIVYGQGSDLWNVFPLASAGQALPAIVPSPGALDISATVASATAVQGSVAVGITLDGSSCIEESNYATGVIFTLSGDLGGCQLFLDLVDSQDESSAEDPCRGACSPGPTCVAPTFQVTQMGMQTVVNMAFTEGGAGFGPNSSKLIGYRFRLINPSMAGVACTAHITIRDVQILGI